MPKIYVKRFCSLFTFLQPLFLVFCLFLLVSCGEDTCYKDNNINDDGTVTSPKTKNFELSTTQDEWLSTGASVSSIAPNNTVTVNVSGTVYMCNSSSLPDVPYATSCQNGKKVVCSKPCYNSKCNYNYSSYADYVDYDGHCSGSTIDDPAQILCGSKENSTCINGVKWVLYGQYAFDINYKEWLIVTYANSYYAQDAGCDINTDCDQYDIKKTDSPNLLIIKENGKERYVLVSGKSKYIQSQDPCSEPITCSGNDEQYVYYNPDDGTSKTYTFDGKCDDSYQNNIGISATNSQWTEIGSNIYNGDVLSFSINAPTDGTPSFLYKGSNYSYQDIGNASINRWAPSKNRYAQYCKNTKCNSKCPDKLEHNTSLSDYSDCAATKQLISDGYEMQSSNSGKRGLWETFGNRLVLKAMSSGNCPTNDNQNEDNCGGTSFNSTSNTGDEEIYSDFGILTNFTDGDGNIQVSTRDFIPKQSFTKLCAKVCDNPYTDNLGGYTLSVQRKSCVAIDGHPSPCCSSGDKRGALMYRWGSDGTPQALFTDVKYSTGDDSTSGSTTTITNGGGSEKDDSNESETDSSKELYFLIKSDSNMRSSTSGTYSINISYTETITTGAASSIIGGIKTSIKDFIYDSKDGQPSPVKQYFNTLSGDADFIQYIRLLLALYIVLYGLSFLMGYVEISQKDLIVRILKIAVVLALISDQSYSFFYDYFFEMFIDGSDELLAKSNFSDSDSYAFSFIDNTFALLVFNQPTWLKVLAIFMTLPFGLLLTILFLVTLIWFVLGVMAAVVVYLMCFLGVAILIFLAPIFISFVLFKHTNYLFKNWCKLLFRFAVEPAMLVIGLQVLVAMFYAIFIQLIDYTVCWKCMMPIKLASVSSIKSFLDDINVTTEVFCLPFFGIHGVYGSKGAAALFSNVGISVSNLLLLMIIAYLIRDYTKFISRMLDGFVGTRIAMLPGESGKSSGSAGELIRSKLGVDKVEKWAGKKLRKGIKTATGFEVLTKEEYEKEKKKENELAKRKGLRKLGIDKDKKKFNDIVDDISQDDTTKGLRQEYGDTHPKAASHLGSNMFEKLAKDKIAYKSFVDGMSSLRSMSADEVDRLDKSAPGIRDLHRVLNSTTVRGSFDDLQSKNDKVKKSAMDRVGKTMFMDKSLSTTLLNKGKRSALSDEIFKLSRKPRSGV